MRKLLVLLQIPVFCIAARWTQNPSGLSEDEQLVVSAQLGNVRALREALASGASIEARDDWGITALMWAASGDVEESVKELLAAGAPVSARWGNGDTALCFAGRHNAAGAVRSLLAGGAEVDERGFREETPLHGAAGTSSIEAAQVLLAHGADVNARNSAGLTPLIIAAIHGSSDEMVQLLIEHGAELDAVDHHANTALDWASREHAIGAAQILRNAALHRSVLSVKNGEFSADPDALARRAR